MARFFEGIDLTTPAGASAFYGQPLTGVLGAGDTLPVVDGSYLFTANYAGASPGAGYAVGDVWQRSAAVWLKRYTDSTVPPSLPVTGLAPVERVGTAVWRYRPQTVRLTGTVTVNAGANVLANVTGLSFSIVSGVRYRFFFNCVYSVPATTTGSRWTLSGPAVTSLAYRSNYPTSATAQTTNFGLAAFGLPAASATNSGAVAGNIAVVEGFVQPSAAGTLQLQAASELAGSAVTVQPYFSFGELERIIP